MRALFLFVLVAALFSGCVWVGSHGQYTRTDTLEQRTTNGNNRATHIELKP